MPALGGICLHPRSQLRLPRTCSMSHSSWFLAAPISVESSNQHTMGMQSMFAGWMSDLIPDRSLSEPHHHKKRNPTLSYSNCFISLDLVKRSWFLYPDHSHCNEGSSPLLLCSGNKLVTPHLFLEPRADTRTNGRHQPCPARCGWGCSLLIVSDQEMLVGKGELLLLQDIKDQITPKGAGATLPERSNHSPDLPGSPA